MPIIPPSKNIAAEAIVAFGTMGILIIFILTKRNATTTVANTSKKPSTHDKVLLMKYKIRDIFTTFI